MSRNNIITTITKSTESWTTKKLEALDLESLLNFVWLLQESGRNDDAQRLMQLQEVYFLIGEKAICASSQVSKGLGDYHLRTQYEHSPAVWVYEHESGIQFVVFSDGWRKHPVRGTSVECVCNTSQYDRFVDAVHDMLEYMVEHSPELVKTRKEQLARWKSSSLDL